MNNTTSPVVAHHHSCRCERCRDARREEQRGRELAHLEAMSGPVCARLGLTKAQPGTVRAINRRYGVAS